MDLLPFPIPVNFSKVSLGRASELKGEYLLCLPCAEASRHLLPTAHFGSEATTRQVPGEAAGRGCVCMPVGA